MSEYYAYSAREQQHGSANDDNPVEHMPEFASVKKFHDLGPRLLRERKQVRRLQIRKRQKTSASVTSDRMMGFGVVKKSRKTAATAPSLPAETKGEDSLAVVLLAEQDRAVQV
ncbi:unnamed protein product [Gongylonema pulchrum]|uniref:Uncharacterized protein n=1 Tax=Gongylonema pulchrum TaxID=637853 RepID=A0A183EH84_9BILA|nr:unnamed protein product [Gongylonema pulchrum]